MAASLQGKTNDFTGPLIDNAGQIVSVPASDGHVLKGRLWRDETTTPLILALHGVMSHSLWLAPVGVALQQRGMSLLAVDRRGAGLNDPRRHDDGVDRLVDDLDSWTNMARSLSTEIHLAGFCWGSNYALQYLASRRWCPRSLILIAPGILLTTKLKAGDAAALLSNSEGEVSVPIPLEDFTSGPYLKQFLRLDPLCRKTVGLRFINIQQRIGQLAGPRLSKLDLPLLMILATRDQVSDTPKLAGLFGKCRAVPKRLDLIDAAHGINFDAPDQIAEICQAWRAQLVAA